MEGLNAFAEKLEYIVARPELHAKWLNTLSLLENVGAKKIKQCEHPVFVKEEILKHAAEESRHAWYLKKQMSKLGEGYCPTYEPAFIFAPIVSSRYLHELDIKISRYLKKEHGLNGHALRYAAYLLVTYAIEVRADELYPVYQKVLRSVKSPVSVNNIIAEEQNHLASMEEQLQKLYENWKAFCEVACKEEAKLFNNWLNAVSLEIN